MQEKEKRLKFFGFPYIWPYIKVYKKRMILIGLLSLLSGAIDSLFPLFNRYAINHFVAYKTLDTIIYFILLYLFCMSLRVLSDLQSTYLTAKVEMEVDRDLRNKSFKHLQTLSFSYFSQNNVGYIHARIMSDTAKIGTVLSWSYMDVVWQFVYILFVIINMLILNFQLAIWIVCLVPIAVLMIIFFQRKIVALNKHMRELNSLITSDLNEAVTGAKAIKTLVVEKEMEERFHTDIDNMLHQSIIEARYSSAFKSLISLISSLALALVLWLGGNLTLAGIFQLGTLSVFMAYALGLMDPIQYLIQEFAFIMSAQANIERFYKLMITVSDVKDEDMVVQKYGDTFQPNYQNWEKLYGDICFENVSFKYPDGEELVLDNFNLKISRGTNVAIVGETGSGKSTLVNLICRFYEPTSGRILIDQRDIRERSQLWLHSNIGYVLQTPQLFSGTIRENMYYGKENASDDEIWRALKLVSADTVVNKLNKGLDSVLDESGANLSTGERQLISFARAIIADPALLILDEATASVDTLTEKKIQEAIQTVIKGRTSFVIAHRLSTIVLADIILVFKNGKIVEKGKHQELMHNKNYYYQLYSQQFKNQEISKVLKHHN